MQAPLQTCWIARTTCARLATCSRRAARGLAATVLLAALLGLSGADLAAQAGTTTGIIRGTVRDPAGEPVPAAVIVIQHRETDLVTTVETSASGMFVRTLLPPGAYDLTVAPATAGFGTERIEGAVLRVGDTVDLDVALRVVASETVTVVSELPSPIDTSDVTRSQRIQEDVVDGLPSNGRNFLNLTLLTPGASISQGPDGDELNISRAARHLQQLHRRRRRLQQPLLRRAARRAAARLHVQPGRHRGPGGGEPGRHRRVRPLRRRVRQRDHEVRNQRAERLGPLLRPVGRDRSGPFRTRAAAGSRTSAATRRGPHWAVRLSCATGPSSSSPTTSRWPTRPSRRRATSSDRANLERLDQFLRARWPGSVRRRVRADPAHRQRAVADRQAGPEPGRPAPSVGQVQLHVVGAGERHLRRRRLGGVGQRDRGRLLARVQRQPALPAHQRALQRAARPVGARGPAALVRGPLLPGARGARPAAVRPRWAGGPSPTSRWTSPTASASGCRSSSRSIRRSTHGSSWSTTCRSRPAPTCSRPGVEYNRTRAEQQFVGLANSRYIFDSVDGFMGFVTHGNRYVTCSDGSSSATLGICPPGAAVAGPVLLYLQAATVPGVPAEQLGVPAARDARARRVPAGHLAPARSGHAGPRTPLGGDLAPGGLRRAGGHVLRALPRRPAVSLRRPDSRRPRQLPAARRAGLGRRRRQPHGGARQRRVLRGADPDARLCPTPDRPTARSSRSSSAAAPTPQPSARCLPSTSLIDGSATPPFLPDIQVADRNLELPRTWSLQRRPRSGPGARRGGQRHLRARADRPSLPLRQPQTNPPSARRSASAPIRPEAASTP